MSVLATCLALALPIVVGFACLLVADGSWADADPETWDNGRVTYGGFVDDVQLDTSQVERG